MVAVIVVRHRSPLLQWRHDQRARQSERESVRATIGVTGRLDDRTANWDITLVASSGRHAKHLDGVAVLYLSIDRDSDSALAADYPVAMAMNSQHDKPKRWRTQMRLWTILLLLVTVAVALGWWSDRRRFDAERLELHAKIRSMHKEMISMEGHLAELVPTSEATRVEDR